MEIDRDDHGKRYTTTAVDRSMLTLTRDDHQPFQVLYCSEKPIQVGDVFAVRTRKDAAIGRSVLLRRIGDESLCLVHTGK